MKGKYCLSKEKVSEQCYQKLKAVLHYRNFHFDDQVSLISDGSNPEDHIYEEIDDNIFNTDDEEEEAEENFLLNISLERRNNLKFYGCAGWDFGNGS